MRAAVLAGLHAVLGDGERSEGVVRRVLRANPTFHNAQRALVADSIHGVACLRDRHAHHAGTREPAWLWAFHLLERGATVAEVAALAQLDGAALRTRHAAPPPWPEDPTLAWATRFSFPPWLAARILDALGPAATAFAQACNQPAQPLLRANALRTTRDALLGQLSMAGWNVTPTRFSPDGITLHGHANLRGSQQWRDGLFEIQDEGSQLVAQATLVTPGMTVVDLCAGSGGKTLALAAMMLDQGTIHATDLNASRLLDLKGRSRRRGLRSVQAHAWGQLPPQQADVVLVDAPCSHLGVLRRSPDLRWFLNPGELDAYPRTQRGLLARALQLCRPGGHILYATCTVLPAENEAVVTGLPGCSLEVVRAGGLTGTPWLNVRPDTHGTDGFFLARLKKDAA